MTEGNDALGRFQTFAGFGHQRDAHVALAGVDAGGLAGEEAAGQDGHIIFSLQPAGELGVGDGRACPQVEARVGAFDFQPGGEQRGDAGKLLAVQAAVFQHVSFVVPRRHRSGLHRRTHRATVVGAVAQEVLQHRRIAGDEAGAHARHVGTLGQAGEHHDVAEIAAPQLLRSLQGAERRGGLVEVDLRIALVGGDHEAVAVGQFEELAPLLQGQYAAGGIARRTHEHQLHVAPHGFRQAVEVGSEAVAGSGVVEEHRFGTAKQGGPFIDLVEGVGRHHLCARLAAIEHALGEGEQRLARTVDRQHLAGCIDRRQGVAAHQPAGDGLAQRLRALRGGVGGHAAEIVGECLQDEGRGGVLRLADRQADRLQPGGRFDALEEGAQFFERVGMQTGEIRIHGDVRLRC